MAIQLFEVPNSFIKKLVWPPLIAQTDNGNVQYIGMGENLRDHVHERMSFASSSIPKYRRSYIIVSMIKNVSEPLTN